MSDWLVSRLNIARRSANDLIAIANRLNDQPELSEVMARAEVSLDQARAASQLPTVLGAEARDQGRLLASPACRLEFIGKALLQLRGFAH